MRKRIERRPAPRRDGRRRRDPRAERDGVAQAAAASAGRFRRDPRRDGRRLNRAAGMTEAARHEDASVRRIDAPACHVAVMPNLDDGRLSDHDRDTIGAARVLADAVGGAVVLIACGGDDDFGAAGADRVMRPDGSFAGYCPELRAAAVVAVAEATDARHILAPEGVPGGGDVARRVAAHLGERPACNVHAFDNGRVIRRSGDGGSEFVMLPPRVLTIAEAAAEPVTGCRHEARAVEAPGSMFDGVLRDGGLLPVDPDRIPLAEAEFIIGGGGGVMDWVGFRQLASALRAVVGASRVVCDEGHLPRDRQVGVSGTIVRPRCYLSLGISGAPQHLEGIAKAERVVSVNRDADCPMARRADLAVVGDVQAVMPALSKLAGREVRDD